MTTDLLHSKHLSVAQMALAAALHCCFATIAAAGQPDPVRLAQDSGAPAAAEPAKGAASQPAAPAAAKPAPKPGPEERDCKTCPVVVVLPDGNAIGKFHVTRGEFAVFAKETRFAGKGCYRNNGENWFKDENANWQKPGYDQTDRHPVVCVNYDDATAYVEWLAKKTGKKYRLPSLEESIAAEVAKGKYWWGDSEADMCQYANVGDKAYKEAFPTDPRPNIPCNDGYKFTAPVGSFRPNALGLYDMVGNVWQWTNSCMNGDCANAVFRGGGWNDLPASTFTAENSYGDRVIVRSHGLGFRVYRTKE
jgi:formylglycine-generating enzyme required for sulfatase activity